MTRALRKTEIRSFILDHLAPRLQDQDWLLNHDEELAKIQDETLFSLSFQRSEWEPSFVVLVGIRPLYWPAHPFVAGLSERIGRWMGAGEGWMDLASPTDAETAATALANVINTRIAPFFAQLRDGKAILNARLAPLTGHSNEILGYIAAWSGERGLARRLLWLASWYMRGDRGDHADQMRAHVKKTLSLLGQPAQLRAFLQETANRIRAESNLNTARPLTELLARRRRPKPPQQDLPS